MLDKIKTLKEILKPDAIKLDIPIDEYISEYHTEEDRFDVLMSQMFHTVAKTRLSRCFNEDYFKKCCSLYKIEYKDYFKKYSKRSLKYANEFNNKYTGKKSLFFYGIPVKSPFSHQPDGRTFIIGSGTRVWSDSLRINQWNNTELYDGKHRIFDCIYKNLINNGASVDNYLIRIRNIEEFNSYQNIFKEHFKGSPDGYSYRSMIDNLFLSFVKKTKEIKDTEHWEVNRKYRDIFLEFSKVDSFWDLNNCKNILDIQEFVNKMESKYKEWCVYNKYTFDFSEKIDLSNKGMVGLSISI